MERHARVTINEWQKSTKSSEKFCLLSVIQFKVLKTINLLYRHVNFQKIIYGKAAAEGILFFHTHLKIFTTTSLEITQ